jgi:hypothetical protein
MDKTNSYAKAITRFASLYNASALVFFLMPGGLGLLGVQEPYSSFWRVLPALLASFAAIVLWISSSDLQKYGAFVSWNGVIRIVFAVVALAAGYHTTVGKFILLLALGDFLVAVLCEYFVSKATKKSIWQLLFNP